MSDFDQAGGLIAGFFGIAVAAAVFSAFASAMSSEEFAEDELKEVCENSLGEYHEDGRRANRIMNMRCTIGGNTYTSGSFINIRNDREPRVRVRFTRQPSMFRNLCERELGGELVTHGDTVYCDTGEKMSRYILLPTKKRPTELGKT